MIKITRVKTYFLDPTLSAKVETDDGLVGWGECSPMNGRVIEAHIKYSLASIAKGRDPFDVEAIVEDMFVRTHQITGQWVAMAASGIAGAGAAFGPHPASGELLDFTLLEPCVIDPYGAGFDGVAKPMTAHPWMIVKLGPIPGSHIDARA